MAAYKLKNYTPTRFMAPDSHYDKAAADYAVSFIEALAHTKGSWAGKPFELIDWQEQIIRDVFGILKPNGYRQFNTTYVEIPKKMGKQVALDTPIPTPDGFSTMGAIAVGDVVFDERGKPCRVVAKSAVDYAERAYRITFKDGEVIEAGENHQWFGEYTHGKNKPCILTTGELARLPRDRSALAFGFHWRDRFPRMCEYGFIEGRDFSSVLSESTGGRPSTDHALSMPMAKELCMLQRNEQGKKFRQYFISVEDAWNSPDKVMERALQIAHRRALEAERRIFALAEENETLVRYHRQHP